MVGLFPLDHKRLMYSAEPRIVLRARARNERQSAFCILSGEVVWGRAVIKVKIIIVNV